jgi:hypothetical protein
VSPHGASDGRGGTWRGAMGYRCLDRCPERPYSHGLTNQMGIGRVKMQLSHVERLSEMVGVAVNRRRFLRGLSSAGLATAGAVGTMTIADAAGSDGSRALTAGDSRQRPDAGVPPPACHVYCTVFDCCGTCCSGRYSLFKCTDSCDGSHFYVCAGGCSGFCYSAGC